MKLDDLIHLLVNPDDVNLLGEEMNTMNKKEEIFQHTINEVGQELNTDINTYIRT
jgi:hypothetical protein